MPGFLLDAGATVQCLHSGRAQAAATCPRVKLGGRPAVTQSAPWTVSGCTMPPPPAGNGPCVTARWTSAATRVKAGGQPVLLQDSQAQCTPTGTGLTVVSQQTKVRGR
ncbi:MAG: hypothetical protein PVG07_07025 [Acidobacteriota bacterium]|jgi:hypothetical protein